LASEKQIGQFPVNDLANQVLGHDPEDANSDCHFDDLLRRFVGSG
jgi:hypothetical protein